ncbi:MAG TPA: superoxide dismutase [Alphaproteobacteria bacterium]|nr:superoxide dismutase [Rhodospirillaceae bacterium]HRJ13104.1 superoxide dismutase [Alphaproteobacteria bacterium]
MTALTLPTLPYALEALQPYMSAETLEYHHGKHHKAYVDKGNELLKGTHLENKSLDEMVKGSFGKPELQPLFNNVAQHWNHMHFWNWMKPGGSGKVPSSIEKKITEDLGGMEKFTADFAAAGMGQFGSGWCWLAQCPKSGKLEIMKTPNGENPLAHGKVALLGCDVWEHSYYIDYRNRRADYLKAFTESLVNWDYVLELYESAAHRDAAAA